MTITFTNMSCLLTNMPHSHTLLWCFRNKPEENCSYLRTKGLSDWNGHHAQLNNSNTTLQSDRNSLLFSFNDKSQVAVCFQLILFFTLPFADGDHTVKGQVHFCLFRKVGLNMSTEILIPWAAGLCSSRAANGRDLAEHMLASLCSTWLQVFFRNQKVEKLVLLS